MVNNNKNKKWKHKNKLKVSKEQNHASKPSVDEHDLAIDKELERGQDTEFEVISLKRNFLQDESETESESKPKKKKKPALSTEQTDNKKGKKSIRQMKKEKHAQRLAEAQASAKDHLKSQCVSYLSQWKHDRTNWKFMKAKQVWLYKNKFSSHLVPDSSWPTLLEYFESAKGNIRTMMLDDANKIIKQMDEWTEAQNDRDNKDEDTAEDSTEQDANKPDDVSYKRARDLIQCLQE